MKLPNTHLYSTYKSLMGKEEASAPLPLTTATATLILVAYTIIYVAPFYFSAATRPSAILNRNAELVIKARIRSVTISTSFCSITTFLLLIHFSQYGTYHDAILHALHSMGYYPLGILSTLKSTILLLLLFSGPLFEAGLVEGSWKSWMRLEHLPTLFSSWHTYRNLVAGPLSEELLFRSASLPLFLLSPATPSTLIFLTPLIFGLAHIHHIYESSFHIPFLSAVLQSLFQLCYTTLFGSFVAFVFLRTGSLLAVILAHAFCNWMGLPRFWGRVGGGGGGGEMEAETVMGGDDIGAGKREDMAGGVRREQYGSNLATVTYYALLFGGSWVFYRNLWTLTDSEHALIKL